MAIKGYRVKEYRCPVKRYCQTMDLKDNPELSSTVSLKPGRKSEPVFVQ